MNIFLSLLGFLLGGSFLGFIEFLIHRKDERNGKFKELEKCIKEINERLDRMEAKADEREAIQARIRILHFADELREDHRHTKERFLQVLSDITLYEQYTESHPDFKNNQAVLTSEFIKESFHERLDKNDFI